jgi:hypothetical protein
MQSYPNYARPAEYHDIPAAPGYRLKQWYAYGGTGEAQLYNVVAWRMFSDGRPGQVLVVGSGGIVAMVPGADEYGRMDYSWAILLPGEE